MNTPPQSSPSAGLVLGRYALHAELASGGMATVHLGRLMGPVGFARTVAIKRLHAMFAKDPEFVSMFLDEARLAGRIRHPNVVPVLDVVAEQNELFLVMEYIHGDSLSKLLRQMRERGETMPLGVAVSIMAGALQGLHAAHETTNDHGEPLEIVHRDISPQNIMVGADGVARVADFGIAKAAGRAQSTQDGQLKGKLCYMAPEQLAQRPVDRRTDVYSASVVLWEVLTGRRLFQSDEPAAVVMQILQGNRIKPSKLNPQVPAALDAVVMKGLTPNPNLRYQTARDMAFALEDAFTPTTPARVGAWVEQAVADSLQARNVQVAEVESLSSVNLPPSTLADVAYRLSAAARDEPMRSEPPRTSPVFAIEAPAPVAGPIPSTSAPVAAAREMPTAPERVAAPRKLNGVVVASVAAAVAVTGTMIIAAVLWAGGSKDTSAQGLPGQASVAASAPSPEISASSASSAAQPEVPLLPGATEPAPSASASKTGKATKKPPAGYAGPAATGKGPSTSEPGFDDLTRR